MSGAEFARIDHTHFFVGDTHFGHAGIIEMAARPFRDITEHDRTLIEHWNSVVKPTDTVWHLGDFAFDKLPIDNVATIFRRLNGVRRLVIGNHDTEAVCALTWESVHHMISLKAGGTEIALSHFPLREWPGFYAGALHFHGHTHDSLPSGKRSWDCGVDHQGFTPLTAEQIMTRMGSLLDYDYSGVPIDQ